MSTETDNRLDEMRERIGELEAKAQAAGDVRTASGEGWRESKRPSPRRARNSSEMPTKR